MTEGLRYCGLGGKPNYDDTFIQGNPSEGKVSHSSILSPPIGLIHSPLSLLPTILKTTKLSPWLAWAKTP